MLNRQNLLNVFCLPFQLKNKQTNKHKFKKAYSMKALGTAFTFQVKVIKGEEVQLPEERTA